MESYSGSTHLKKKQKDNNDEQKFSVLIQIFPLFLFFFVKKKSLLKRKIGFIKAILNIKKINKDTVWNSSDPDPTWDEFLALSLNKTLS